MQVYLPELGYLNLFKKFLLNCKNNNFNTTFEKWFNTKDYKNALKNFLKNEYKSNTNLYSFTLKNFNNIKQISNNVYILNNIIIDMTELYINSNFSKKDAINILKFIYTIQYISKKFLILTANNNILKIKWNTDNEYSYYSRQLNVDFILLNLDYYKFTKKNKYITIAHEYLHMLLHPYNLPNMFEEGLITSITHPEKNYSCSPKNIIANTIKTYDKYRLLRTWIYYMFYTYYCTKS